MSGIIWLASYPKSGNTWLRAFLANYLSNSQQAVPINELPNFVLGDNFLVHYEQFTGRKVEELTPEEIAEIRPRIHQWFATYRGQDVFVKTHNAIVVLGGKPLITPDATAGAIYVIRNPFDVAVSFAHHYQVTVDRAVESLCEEKFFLPPSGGQLSQYLLSWSGHYRSWTSAPGLTHHVMRYEDMLDRPEKAFGGVVKFLSLPKDPARLKKAIRFSSFRELAAQETRKGFVEARPDGKSRFFRSGRKGAWRKVLNQSQIDRLVEAHGEVMREMGYLSRDGKILA